MNYLMLILLLFRIEKVYTFSKKELFENINLYSNELCSYNGIPKITETNEVVCESNERYANETIKKNIKYINNIMIQCSYQRKSRFFTIFLALCIPIGFDFLYLAFSIALFLSLITITLSIILFIMNYRINLKSKESIIQMRLNKMTNKESQQKKMEMAKVINIWYYYVKSL